VTSVTEEYETRDLVPSKTLWTFERETPMDLSELDPAAQMVFADLEALRTAPLPSRCRWSSTTIEALRQADIAFASTGNRHWRTRASRQWW